MSRTLRSLLVMLALISPLGPLAADCDQTAGRFLVVRDDVQVVDRNGSTRAVTEEDEFCVGETIITPKKGRARLEFSDLARGGKAGPTRINVGTSTRFTIADLTLVEGDVPTRRLDLHELDGAIRVWAVNWTLASEVRVKQGRFECSLRGSGNDMRVDADLQAGTAAVLANEGTVVCAEGGSGELGDLHVFSDGSELRWEDGAFQPVASLTREDWMTSLERTELLGAPPVARLSNRTVWRVGYFGKIRLTGAPSGRVATYKVPSHDAEIIGTYDGTNLEGYWYAPKIADRPCPEPREGTKYWGRIEVTLDPATNKLSGVWGRCGDDPSRSIRGSVSREG